MSHPNKMFRFSALLLALCCATVLMCSELAFADAWAHEVLKNAGVIKPAEKEVQRRDKQVRHNKYRRCCKFKTNRKHRR